MSETHQTNYVKIWAILVGLLVLSVAGPMLEIRVVTLITAFGIAVVKAFLVAQHFMHLNIEKRIATYMLVTCLVFLLLFFAGTAPDVMQHDGWQWEKPLVKHMVAEGLAAMEAGHPVAGGGSHH